MTERDDPALDEASGFGRLEGPEELARLKERVQRIMSELFPILEELPDDPAS